MLYEVTLYFKLEQMFQGTHPLFGDADALILVSGWVKAVLKVHAKSKRDAKIKALIGWQADGLEWFFENPERITCDEV